MFKRQNFQILPIPHSSFQMLQLKMELEKGAWSRKKNAGLSRKALEPPPASQVSPLSPHLGPHQPLASLTVPPRCRGQPARPREECGGGWQKCPAPSAWFLESSHITTGKPFISAWGLTDKSGRSGRGRQSVLGRLCHHPRATHPPPPTAALSPWPPLQTSSHQLGSQSACLPVSARIKVLTSGRRSLFTSLSTKGTSKAVGNDSEKPLRFPFTEGTCQRNLDPKVFNNRPR